VKLILIFIHTDTIMKQNGIAIIGGGNLGAAIAEGLIRSGFVDGRQITVTRRNVEVIRHLKELGASVTNDNAAAIKSNDVIIVALKPYNVREVLEGLKN